MRTSMTPRGELGEKGFLHVPKGFWNDFRAAMLSSRSGREEVGGFIFCNRQALSTGETRLFPRDFVVPRAKDYEAQTATGLTLKQEFHVWMLNEFVRSACGIVHVHTHPGREQPAFSSVDDEAERAYAEFLGHYRPNTEFVSVVCNEDMSRTTLRRWDASTGKARDDVDLRIGPFLYSEHHEQVISKSAKFSRQEIFGATFQEKLGNLTLGLVGCGGIGAVAAEQLARLGVKHWLLVDPDVVEESNLNRFPFATIRQARAQTPKVVWVERIIRRFWGSEAKIRKRKRGIANASVRRALAECDLIIVATDNEYSRLIAQKVASGYVRPLLCLGTFVDVVRKGSGTGRSVRAFARVTLPPMSGNKWCLVCGEVIDPTQAALEEAAAEIQALARVEGYVSDVRAPAVYWLNSACASLCVNVIHGIVANFFEAGEGLDWILDFGSTRWHTVDHQNSKSCLFCSRTGDGFYGSGHV